jgi:hypothetical protein
MGDDDDLGWLALEMQDLAPDESQNEAYWQSLLGTGDNEAENEAYWQSLLELGDNEAENEAFWQSLLQNSPPAPADPAAQAPAAPAPFRPAVDSQQANEQLGLGPVVPDTVSPAVAYGLPYAAQVPTSVALPPNTSAGGSWGNMLSNIGNALTTPAGMLTGLAALAALRGSGNNSGSAAAGMFQGEIPKYKASRQFMPGRVTDENIKGYVAANIDNPQAIGTAARYFGVSTDDLSRATGFSPTQVQQWQRDNDVETRRPGSAPLRYFGNTELTKLAAGGQVPGGLHALANRQAQGFPLQSNAFVLPADVISALGNGSTNAGAERVRSMFGGGQLIDGPGDGQSDSIPAHIDGQQPAAVARGEMYMDPQLVARAGNGSHPKGVAALHQLMNNTRQQAYGNPRQQRRV